MSDPRAANVLDLKTLNTALVRRALRDARTATCRDLAASTGLSTATVGTLLQNLVTGGEVLEAELLPSNGGRPSRLYRFHETHALVLAVLTREVAGQDTLCLRVADLYGRVVASDDRPLAADSLQSFEPAIGALLSRYPAVGALGFGLPGIELGGRIAALDYPALVGSPLVDHFRSRYGRPVVFENDVNAAVLGRGRRPGAPASEVYLYFPKKYAPGAGIRVDGRLLKGRRHFAGEVGHLPLGIVWGEELAASFDRLNDAVARVVASITTVVDPDSIVLHGEFLTPAHRAEVQSRCEALLPPDAVPQITLADDFTSDFQEGLIALTLDLLEPKTPFSRPSSTPFSKPAKETLS